MGSLFSSRRSTKPPSPQKTYDHYRSVVWTSIGLSWLLFLIMLGSLIPMGVYESTFFSYRFESDNPPKLLGVPIKSEVQFWGIGIFFFLNAFLGVWNGIVIAPIFDTLVVDTKATLYSVSGFHQHQAYSILVLYEIWRGVRAFFSLLGLLSNVVFFGMTTLGALTASFITKYMFTHDQRDYLQHLTTTNGKPPEDKTLQDLKDPRTDWVVHLEKHGHGHRTIPHTVASSYHRQHGLRLGLLYTTTT